MIYIKKYFFLFSAFFLLCTCNSGNKREKNDGNNSAEKSSQSPMSYEEMEMKEKMEAQKNRNPQENPYKDAKIDIHVFSNDTIKKLPKLTGFGYDILIYDAVYNHQPHIPAINGMRGFNTKEQAYKAAELVVHKIRNNIMPPGLTVQELDSLGTLN